MTILPPQQVGAKVALPASKSISNRALVLQALSSHTIELQNLAECDDTDVLISALKNMPYEINIGAAGTAMRFLTAYLAVTPGEHVLTGSDRMKQRPISILVDALRNLGADIEYLEQDGFPPLLIKGTSLRGGRLQIDGSVSSQYISALLLVNSKMQNPLKLSFKGKVASKPYIEMTKRMISEFSLLSQNRTQVYSIENDWSAASYWYEIVALCTDKDAEIVLTGLHEKSLQGDSIVKFIFSLLGVKTEFLDADTVRLTKSGRRVSRLQFDFRNCPDLVQTVVCSCCALGVPFSITGVESLRIKETDRIRALQKELRKLGFSIACIKNHTLEWDGKRTESLRQPIDTYNDHRMAMAFAPMAFANGLIRINNPEVVTKSYPQYWEELKRCGFSL